jgi:hypothetical protein
MKIEVRRANIPNELLRYILRRAKVPRRIEWQSRDGASTVRIQTILSAADGEEGPSRRVPRAGNAANVAGFEEVELVDGAAVHASRQYCHKLEQDTASEDYEGDDAHDCSWMLLAHVIIMSAREGEAYGCQPLRQETVGIAVLQDCVFDGRG